MRVVEGRSNGENLQAGTDTWTGQGLVLLLRNQEGEMKPRLNQVLCKWYDKHMDIF